MESTGSDYCITTAPEDLSITTRLFLLPVSATIGWRECILFEMDGRCYERALSLAKHSTQLDRHM